MPSASDVVVVDYGLKWAWMEGGRELDPVVRLQKGKRNACIINTAGRGLPSPASKSKHSNMFAFVFARLENAGLVGMGRNKGGRDCTDSKLLWISVKQTAVGVTCDLLQ